MLFGQDRREQLEMVGLLMGWMRAACEERERKKSGTSPLCTFTNVHPINAVQACHAAIHPYGTDARLMLIIAREPITMRNTLAFDRVN